MSFAIHPSSPLTRLNQAETGDIPVSATLPKLLEARADVRQRCTVFTGWILGSSTEPVDKEVWAVARRLAAELRGLPVTQMEQMAHGMDWSVLAAVAEEAAGCTTRASTTAYSEVSGTLPPMAAKGLFPILIRPFSELEGYVPLILPATAR